MKLSCSKVSYYKKKRAVQKKNELFQKKSCYKNATTTTTRSVSPPPQFASLSSPPLYWVGVAAVAILWGFTMTLTLNIMCVESTAMEARMTSVERLDEYSRLPPEEPAAAGDGKADPDDPDDPDPAWPTLGAVEFRDVSFRYRADLPLALRSFSVRIEAGEHMGVCGRTGFFSPPPYPTPPHPTPHHPTLPYPTLPHPTPPYPTPPHPTLP